MQGLHADRLIAAGGGTRNPLLMQAKADMTGRCFILSQQTQATAAGAAMLAAEAVKEPKCPGDFSGEGSPERSGYRTENGGSPEGIWGSLPCKIQNLSCPDGSGGAGRNKGKAGIFMELTAVTKMLKDAEKGAMA